MRTRLILAAALILALGAGSANAQRRGGGGGYQFAPMDHKAEIHAFYGYNWQSDYEATWWDNNNVPRVGRFDLKSSDNFGFELDVNVRPGAQLALLYNRMQTEMTFNPSSPPGPKRTFGDIDVEYWHIGALSGPFNGKMMPYGGMTLGGTRFAAFDQSIWKFSFMPQIGVKFYPHPKIAFRAHARLPITLLNTGFGFGFGSGGGSVSVGGTGTVGFDLGGGIALLLGG
jgi:hypothetical protein